MRRLHLLGVSDYIDLEDVADRHEILMFELIFEMLTGIIRQINNFVKNNKNDEFLIYAFLFLYLCSANKKVCFIDNITWW